MSALTSLRRENFETAVIQSPIPVLIDFYANWCGPCRLLAPVLERIQTWYPGQVRFLKVDVDEEPEMAEYFGISSIPTLGFFQNGQMVDRHEGLIDPRVLMTKLDQLAGITLPREYTRRS